AGRQAIGAALKLLVELDQRALDVVADAVADNDQRSPRLARGVDELDARDLPEQSLERRRDPVLDLLGAGAGHGHLVVDHRHLDLRLLLARQDRAGDAAAEDRAEDEERRQFGVDEGLRDRAGEAAAARDLHGRTSTGWPSASSSSPATTTASPPDSPESISTRPARARPA